MSARTNQIFSEQSSFYHKWLDDREEIKAYILSLETENELMKNLLRKKEEATE